MAVKEDLILVTKKDYYSLLSKRPIITNKKVLDRDFSVVRRVVLS